MNNDFDFEYNDFDELYESMMETGPEDWLPDAGIRETFDPETQKLLNQFWHHVPVHWTVHCLLTVDFFYAMIYSLVG